MKYSKTIVCFLALLCLGLLGNFTPQANAALNGDIFVTEITTAPSEVNAVAIDSVGRLFVGADNDIYRSIDAGATWTKVLDGPSGFPSAPFLLFVDSRDHVFTMITNVTGNNNQLYRSVDNGLSWSKVLNNIQFSSHMCEAPNGDLYFNTYTTVNEDYIYKSTDTGATWSVFYDLTGIVDHFHRVAVAPNGYIYATTGDGEYHSTILRFNGASWETIANDTIYQMTPVFFDGNYVYFLTDCSHYSYRMPLTGSTTADFEIIMFNKVVFTESNNFYDGCKVGDVYVGGTSEGQLWASWDGIRWIKVFDDMTGVIRSITRRGFPLYFVKRFETQPGDKLYRLSLTKEDIIRLYYREYCFRRGSETNAEDYVLEQSVFNGLECIDLTHVALSNVQASIKGLSVENVQANAGFESGSMSSWSFSTSPQAGNKTIISTSGYFYEGSYAVNITKNVADAFNMYFVNDPFTTITMKKGDIAVGSIWAKANTPLTQTLGLTFYNSTSGLAKTVTEYRDVSTSWQRLSWFYRSSASSPFPVRILFTAKKGSTYQLYVDASMLELKDCHIVRGDVGASESIQFWNYTPTTYATPSISTSNPTLTINGQEVSHSGTLTNGTESSATSLSGILIGVVKVEANIQGSGQAILRITGKRVLYEDSIILKGRKDSVYYGRYYGTFSPTITTSDLVAVTNLASNITSLSKTIGTLTLTIDSPSETTSTTKVYVGDKGQPRNVSGATTWTYDSASNILTITASHSSSVTIIVRWRLKGDVNDDGSIDVSDLNELAEAFGSTGGPPPSPNWNQDADINEDNNINSLDLHTLGKNYGKTDQDN